MIQINYQDKRPIYEQIVERFRQLIVSGALQEDEKIPSVRSLAIDLSINPNTIQKAYQELERLGFIYTVKGRGNFVAGRAQWSEECSEEYKKQLNSVLNALKALGVPEDEILGAVHSIMKGGVQA